ncbi:MAG: 4Fe-4S binding protein, partial [Spirochaetaceae bacterium]|nr:4Fe-4S binding protein [Spirochaetaceae bacterium]
FFMTEHGISIANIYSYVIYYGIVLLFLIPAVVHGKRANCHYICWMAPFMIMGYKFGCLLHLPQLKIKAQRESCVGCGACSKVCPMSVDVKKLVKDDSSGTGNLGELRTSECILCGECISACPKKVLNYKMGIK